jgi:hypothetical protein
MIQESFRDIVGGSGGPNQNAIPVYSDKNAPKGGQVFGPTGAQLMLENSDISGVHYVIVDPALITAKDNDNSRFMTFKENGQVYYIRLWIMDRDGNGVDYAPDTPMWVEYSHLRLYVPAPEPGKLHKLLLEEISSGEWAVQEL